MAEGGIKKLPDNTLTPDSIMNILFRMDSVAEYYHLQTTSYAQHKMLDELHESIEDAKDSICEYLLGMQAPKKFGVLKPDCNAEYSDANVTRFLADGIKFSIQLAEYGNNNNMRQLANMANELEGNFAKARYLNTLK